MTCLCETSLAISAVKQMQVFSPSGGSPAVFHRDCLTHGWQRVSERALVRERVRKWIGVNDAAKARSLPGVILLATRSPDGQQAMIEYDEWK